MPREIYSIVCDDIRFEQGNKVSLIGVYDEGILVPRVPFSFPRLCVAQRIQDIKDVKKIRFVLKGPGMNKKSPEIENKEFDKAVMATYAIFDNVKFEKEGDYQFETYLNNETKPIIVRNFYVHIRPELKV